MDGCRNGERLGGGGAARTAAVKSEAKSETQATPRPDAPRLKSGARAALTSTSKGTRLMDLKGSHTERNLVTAFVGESVARNRYTFFASQAKNDGYIQIAQVFEETANQEKEHAKRFFKFLQGGEVRIECGFPAGVVGPTLENLPAAAEGENEEWSALYPSFAAKAREEGFKTIGVDLRHGFGGREASRGSVPRPAGKPPDGRVFKRDQPVKWVCLNCGYVHEGPEAPAACPACAIRRPISSGWSRSGEHRPAGRWRRSRGG